MTSIDLSHNTALTSLFCSDNALTALDLDANTALELLDCSFNDLTTLDLGANTELISLLCYRNRLTSLDLGTNTALRYLNCRDNELPSLDLSANTDLYSILCLNNRLTALNLKNGANTQLYTFSAIGNPDLACVQVDNVVYAMTNWIQKVDASAKFSADCSCPNSYGSLSPLLCSGAAYTAPDGQVFTQAGLHFAAVPNAAGCDSIIQISLAFREVPVCMIWWDAEQQILTTIGTTDFVHITWFSCAGGQYDSIASGPVFTVTADGQYSAAGTTADGCIGYSSCLGVTLQHLGTPTGEIPPAFVSVYPNPAVDVLNIGGDIPFSAYRLSDATGRVQESRSLSGGGIPVAHLSPGIYHLLLETSDGRTVTKVVAVSR